MLLANIVANKAAKLTCQLNFQQIRFAKKTFLLKFRYGDPPILTQEHFDKVLENNSLDDLRYKPIRFALIWEYGSPLFDEDLELFTKYMMKGGRKSLAYELMNLTFYKIKAIQYSKLRKLREKAALSSGSEINIDSGDKTNEESAGDPIEDATATNETKIETNPLEIFKGALQNAEPVLITRKVKRGGATYQVPYPIKKRDSQYYSIKWMIEAVLDRPKPRKKHFPEVMAQELIEAYYNHGKVVKRKDDMHRLADANKAYAHYRWG